MGMSKAMIRLTLAAAFGAASISAAAAAPDIYDMTSVARKSLKSLQHQSFANDREYCGMIGETAAGELVVTPARRGSRSGCDPRGFTDRTIKTVASYHTHGAFHPDADAEVPSVMDLDMDYAEQVFGFVATPGGRLWITNFHNRTVTQVCGLGCLPSDPNFKPGVAGDIPKTLTRRELTKRKGAGGPKYLRARSEAEN